MGSKVEEKKEEASKVASYVAERGVGGSLYKAAETESHLPQKSATAAPASAAASAAYRPASLYSLPATQWCAATQSYQPIPAPDLSAVTFHQRKPNQPQQPAQHVSASKLERLGVKPVQPPAEPSPQLPIGDQPLTQPTKLLLLQSLYTELDSTNKAIEWIGRYLPKLALNDELARNKKRIMQQIEQVMNGRWQK